VSNRLNILLQEFTLGTESFSIDETFIDITGYAERYGLSREKFAYYLKLKIKKEIGIPVSIGVGRSKIIAKLLSDYNKPYGQCSGVEPQTLQRIYKELSISEVCYIGTASSEKLSSYCKNIEQFARMDYKTVRKLLGL
jgi:DNA polymerase IV